MSIIVPTYNAAQYLDKGLTSFIVDEELMNKLEVIVVNDGTPDNSVEIASKYVAKYPDTFRILNKKNGGHGSAINAGVKAAQGRYFKVIDADDWVDEEGFPKFIRVLENVDAQVVVTPYQKYDISNGAVTDMTCHPTRFRQNYNMGQVMDQWQQICDDMHFWGVTYNTEFYRSLNYDLLEGVFYEDQEFATVPASYAKTPRLLSIRAQIFPLRLPLRQERCRRTGFSPFSLQLPPRRS